MEFCSFTDGSHDGHCHTDGRNTKKLESKCHDCNGSTNGVRVRVCACVCLYVGVCMRVRVSVCASVSVYVCVLASLAAKLSHQYHDQKTSRCAIF